MRLLAIDPGTTESAYVLYTDGRIDRHGKEPNAEVGRLFRSSLFITDAVCERIRSFGMPAGAELFETCEWCGRFQQQAIDQGINWHWLTRIEVKSYICHSSRAKDANIRQAIIDRFGGIAATKKGGPLYRVSGDVWAALAVAITWSEQQEFERRLRHA